MAEDERQVMVDALRAVALLGIVIVNAAAYRRGVGPNLAAGGGRVGGEVDGLTVGLSALAEGRFYPLFSLLFGWGFAVQDARSRVRGRSVAGPWLRRCGVLLLLGVVHDVLLFDGDILTTYAVLGVALLAVRSLRPVWLVALGVSLVVTQALFSTALVALSSWLTAQGEGGGAGARADSIGQLVADARVFGDGSFADVVALRAGDLVLGFPLGLLSVGGTVLGMMVLGVAVARVGWVDPRRWPAWLRTGVVPLWLAGLVLSVPSAWLLGDIAVGTDGAGRAALAWASYSLLGPVMALLWAGVVVRAGLVGRLRPLLVAIAPAGRMSLTLYLTQSLVASLLFNGYGLDLGDRLGIGASVAVMVAVWAVQVVAARLWFRRFSTGPLEALTRAAAYGQRPSRRRRAAPSPLAASGGPG